MICNVLQYPNAKANIDVVMLSPGQLQSSVQVLRGFMQFPVPMQSLDLPGL